MQIVISALHFGWKTITDCLARAAGWGLDGVEFSWHPSFARPHCTLADVAAVADIPGNRKPLLTAHIWEDLPALELTDA